MEAQNKTTTTEKRANAPDEFEGEVGTSQRHGQDEVLQELCLKNAFHGGGWHKQVKRMHYLATGK